MYTRKYAAPIPGNYSGTAFHARTEPEHPAPPSAPPASPGGILGRIDAEELLLLLLAFLVSDESNLRFYLLVLLFLGEPKIAGGG